MKGIINWFVLSKMFGEDFQLIGALIDNINDKPLERNLTIDLIIGNKVIIPPNKWEKWDKVYVKIDFSFVKELSWIITDKNFIIDSISCEGKETFCMNIKDKSCNVLKFNFEAAHIQNIKPLIFNRNFGYYEVSE